VYLPPTSPWLAPDSSSSPEFRSLAEKLAPRVMNVALSVSGDPAGVASAARAAIGALDPTLPVFDMVPMSRVLSTSMARTTFTGWMLGGAAAISLVLGVIGIYGVVAYTVSLRLREIGLRLALGARPAEVGLMLVRQGMILVGIGIATGMVLTFVITGSLRALLFGVSPNDPVTLGLVALVLISATLFATWIPARRAGHVDPALTLVGE
ncbi:MAG: FtsX-like permease family protein, partial [Gemmatimonadota bacterium]